MLDFQEEKGYTFDSEHNDVIEHHERMRYDRILCNRDGALRPTNITMVGNQPLDIPLHADPELVRLSLPPPRPTRAAPSSSSSSSTSSSSSSTVPSTTSDIHQISVKVPDDDDDDDDDSGSDVTPPSTPPRRVKMLYPSDHFGLLCSFDFVSSSCQFSALQNSV